MTRDMGNADRPSDRDVISFGYFRLFVTERRLERDGIAVRLSEPALDVLIALIERATEVVDEKELAAKVWPDRTVKETSLRLHMASLRKALADGGAGAQYVTKVLGYRFAPPTLRFMTSSLAAGPALEKLPRAPTRQPLVNQQVGRAAKSSHALDQRRLQRVLAFVEANLESAISVEDLASVAALSPFHFSRAFRHATGRTPHRFVIDRRLEKAKKLLATGESTLSEIALICNFSSQASFTKAFTNAVGLPPGQYRRTRSKKNDHELLAIAEG